MERHDDVQARLTDFVLEELPQRKRAQVAAHLASCGVCAAEARGLADAFAAVGLAVEPAAPPAALRRRVMDALAQERPTTATTSAAAVRLPVRGWRGRRAILAMAAALVLVLGGLLAASMQRTQRLGEERDRVAKERSQLAARIAETGVQADLAVSILTASDLHRIDLAGQDVSPNATARGYWSVSRGLLIVADRLPRPPAGRTYQVWLIGSSSAGPVSAGLIPAEQVGRGMLIVPAPAGVAGSGVTIAITDEPRGGRQSPTGAKHLVGSL